MSLLETFNPCKPNNGFPKAQALFGISGGYSSTHIAQEHIQDTVGEAQKCASVYQAWELQSLSLRSMSKFSPSYKPWTSRPDTSVAKQLEPRASELLDICWALQLKNHRTSVLPGKGTGKNKHKAQSQSSVDTLLRKSLFCDLSERVARKPWGPFRTLTQSCQMYSFEGDGILTPDQHMILQGMPSELDLSGLDSTHVRSLAGEAFSAPCVGSIIWALFLLPSAPWWTGTPS
jgi:hypothetical protein